MTHPLMGVVKCTARALHACAARGALAIINQLTGSINRRTKKVAASQNGSSECVCVRVRGRRVQLVTGRQV